MVYGPFAFAAGILLANGSKLAWIGVVPLVWFIGMTLSHIVLGKCVLNWLASKLKSTKGRADVKSVPYRQGYAPGYRRPLRSLHAKPSKADKSEISDSGIFELN